MTGSSKVLYLENNAASCCCAVVGSGAGGGAFECGGGGCGCAWGLAQDGGASMITSSITVIILLQ